MQQIYTQNHEDFEVYTTVLSPQVCRRVIIKHQGEMMVVGTDYCTDCEEEVCVRAGEVVLMLYQENTDWCYVRLQNGREGYLPTVCFSVKQDPSRHNLTPVQQLPNERKSSSGGHSLKQLRRASLSSVTASPRLLRQFLSRPRRRSDGQNIIQTIGSINPAFHQD